MEVMTARPKCFEEADVRLTGRDVWTIRQALQFSRAASTRHEHVIHDINSALEKLPAVHEPGGGACACFEEAQAGTSKAELSGGGRP